jgi:hypothetical protein
LEEDLLRLDQLTTQVQKATEDAREQATSLASRTRSELTKSVEERHQEMISTMSDLRADLRSQKNAAPGQPNELEKPDRDTPRLSSETASSRPARLQDSSSATTSLVSEQKTGEEPPSHPDAKKKRFWSRLNPFSRNKNKQQDSAVHGTAQ